MPIDPNEEMLEAARPLIKYLSQFHPHHTIVVTHDGAELLEGKRVVKTEEFLKD